LQKNNEFTDKLKNYQLLKTRHYGIFFSSLRFDILCWKLLALAFARGNSKTGPDLSVPLLISSPKDCLSKTNLHRELYFSEHLTFLAEISFRPVRLSGKHVKDRLV
jgi:hypothetical protein